MKLPIGGAQHEILSWAHHEFSFEEQSMLRLPGVPNIGNWQLRIADLFLAQSAASLTTYQLEINNRQSAIFSRE